MTPGPLQIVLIIILILLLFGASRVPNIAENLAKGIKSFKRGLSDDDAASAADAAAALAKFAYSRMFDWLVQRVNKSMGGSSANSGML